VNLLDKALAVPATKVGVDNSVSPATPASKAAVAPSNAEVLPKKTRIETGIPHQALSVSL
jgi:hypothetical protein